MVLNFAVWYVIWYGTLHGRVTLYGSITCKFRYHNSDLNYM